MTTPFTIPLSQPVLTDGEIREIIASTAYRYRPQDIARATEKVLAKRWEDAVQAAQKQFPQPDRIALAYIIKGFWAKTPINAAYERAKDAAGGSEDHLMAALIELSPLDDALWQQQYANAGDTGPWFDGVWYYEMSEPFGEALAAHVQIQGELPDKEQARELLQNIFNMARS